MLVFIEASSTTQSPLLTSAYIVATLVVLLARFIAPVTDHWPLSIAASLLPEYVARVVLLRRTQWDDRGEVESCIYATEWHMSLRHDTTRPLCYDLYACQYNISQITSSTKHLK